MTDYLDLSQDWLSLSGRRPIGSKAWSIGFQTFSMIVVRHKLSLATQTNWGPFRKECSASIECDNMIQPPLNVSVSWSLSHYINANPFA